jgi:hypothetical protein
MRSLTRKTNILGSAGIAEKNGATFADEEIVHSGGVERFRHLLRLEWVEGRVLVHGNGAGWKPR